MRVDAIALRSQECNKVSPIVRMCTNTPEAYPIECSLHIVIESLNRVCLHERMLEKSIFYRHPKSIVNAMELNGQVFERNNSHGKLNMTTSDVPNQTIYIEGWNAVH